MKVILTQDVKGTGTKEQIVEVSDGYARNYLFPRKLAVAASDDNLNAIKNRKAATAHKKEQEVEKAKLLAVRLGEVTVRVAVKAGENGRLFGSVTTQEIVDALKTQHGVELDKRKVSLPEHIKATGPAKAEVRLGADIAATLDLIIEKA